MCAQPATGLKIGANYTFYNDGEVIEYSPEIGYQLGYAWHIKLSEALALSIEGMFTKKTSRVKSIGEHEFFGVSDIRYAYYISAPLGINYHFNNTYIGLGYEFGVNTDTGNLPVNRYDHALFVQAAYQIRYFDIALKYAGSLNSEAGRVLEYEVIDSNTPKYYTSKAKTIQLSLIFNFGKKAQ